MLIDSKVHTEAPEDEVVISTQVSKIGLVYPLVFIK